MNFVDQVRQYLGTETFANVSDALSEPPQRVNAAMSAAVPTLLAAIADKVCRPETARPVVRAVDQTDSSILDRFADSTRGRQLYPMMESGAREFTSMFGRDASDGMAHAISRFSGLGVSSAHSLLSLLTPPTLAALARHARTTDSSGLCAFLATQRPAIAAAIPAGVYEYFGQIPSLSFLSFRQHPYDEGVAATSTDDDMEEYSSSPRQEIVTGSHGDDIMHGRRARAADFGAEQVRDKPAGGLAWAIPVMIVLALLAGISYFLSPNSADNTIPLPAGQRAAVDGTQGELEAVPAAGRLDAASESEPLGDLAFLRDDKLASDLSTTFTDLRTTMKQLNEGQNHLALEPKLRDISLRLDGLTKTVAALPPESRTTLDTRISQISPEIEAQARAAMAKPNSERIKPHLQKIVTSLRQLSHS